MAEETTEMSKNEQKKLAKKAEKAAKKAAKGGGGTAPPAAASNAGGGGNPATNSKNRGSETSTGTPSSSSLQDTAPLPSTAPKTLLLYNGREGCSATLKAIWASQLFNVQLGVAKKKDFPAGYLEVAGTAKPALIYDGANVVLGGGGNAMCKAISIMGYSVDPATAPVAVDTFLIDEWCEVERTTMRKGRIDVAILEKLATGLSASPTGVYLVGDKGVTIADICTIVALSQQSEEEKAKWPTVVQNYYKVHEPALERAKASAPSYLSNPPIDYNNPSLVAVVTHIFQSALEEVFPTAEIPNNLINKCQNPKHGDYQCMAAMPVFASMKKSNGLPEGIQSPPQVAKALVTYLEQKNAQAQQSNGVVVVTELTVQGPGFVLCRIASSYLQKHVQTLLSNAGQLPKPNVPPQQCVVDFSSPNIAKEMHVGHLRSTIIGEAVCRILEYVGHSVARVNHVGDWGTQFGMLIQYLKEEYPNFADSMPNITDLTAFYKAAKERFDADPEFKKTSQINVVKLQSGDEECRKIWHILCDVSRKEFQKVYDRLDVTVEECGESFYNDKIPSVIQEFEKAGRVKIEEGGAKCVFVDKFKVPLMLQKSDGGFGYDSTDMAALKHRLHTIKAQRIIVITDFSQGDHFKMCNSAARDIGWVDQGQKLEHIGFGTVQGEDGKRFKTRSGDTVRLVDLLDEAVSRMEASLKERINENKANITIDEVHEVAEAIGYGAVKYFDLRRNPTSNYKFSYDGMLDTKGNTAVYLLYARVRLESIATKAKEEHNVDVEELVKNGTQVVLDHPSERNLALQLQQFADTIEITLDDLFPYHICEYVYNLSIAASEFVTQCRVLGSPEMNSRLLMCYATTMAMRQCFDLLGIRHVKRI